MLKGDICMEWLWRLDLESVSPHARFVCRNELPTPISSLFGGVVEETLIALLFGLGAGAASGA